MPAFPEMRWGATFTGSTASVSTSIYGETYEILPNALAAVTSFAESHPLKEWGLSVNAIGGSPQHWQVDVEVSNDDATWTSILRHRNGQHADASMAWGTHRTARRARLTVSAVSAGTTITATAFASP